MRDVDDQAGWGLAAEAVMSKSAATGVSPKEGRDVRRLHYGTDRRYIKKSADKM